MTEHPAVRAPTALDALADRLVVDTCALDPYTATVAGVAGHEGEVTDYSPDGFAARADLARHTLGALEGAEAVGPVDPVDPVDAVTLAALRERLGLQVQLADAGLDRSGLALLNVVESPLQNARDTFDLMATATPDHWAAVASRLHGTARVLSGTRASLAAVLGSSDPGLAPTRRQALACAEQCDALADPARGQLADLVTGARLAGGEPLPPALAGDLGAGLAVAASAFAEHARHLREHVAPLARTDDAVGPEAYALHSRSFLGAAVDLEETYAWGLEEVARLEAEMASTAQQISPGASVPEAIALLEADPARRVEGTDALRAWMQELSDAAVAGLADVHFDVPEPVRTLACRIAPSASGGIYYTPPSEDFTRPGTMWWSVPEGVTSFGLWSERTTVFHEGVPGHHLQVAQTMYRADLLNRWRRLLCWVSGHGEGWALYAERLMADLGWLDDPGDRMGMLEGSLFRAARVVVDIGTHCGFEAPASVGGGRWGAERMWTYLRAHTYQADPVLRFEHLRYLGWPGQAPSYKVGERLWLELREQVRAEQGAAFDLRAFHRRALDVGSVGLDVLREALVGAG